MKKNTINIGDHVLQCIPWTPGMVASTVLGEGVVTLIAEGGEDKRNIRVLWTTGVVDWHPENELVNIKNVKR